MKKTIHDGSRSYSIVIPNPEPGKGKHAKTPWEAYKRHVRNVLRKKDLDFVFKKARDI